MYLVYFYNFLHSKSGSRFFVSPRGLTWVGDEPPGADDRGAEGAEGGDVSVAAQLSRPNSALAEELVDLQVTVEVGENELGNPVGGWNTPSKP